MQKFNVILLHYILYRFKVVVLTVTSKSVFLDKFAVLLTGICIVHCLIAPIALTMLPIITLSSMVEDILFHQMMLWLVLPSSLFALFIGCKKHRNFGIVGTGLLGLTILVAVAILGHDVLSIAQEKVLTIFGGLVLAASHVMNYRACQSQTCSDDNCATEHHH